MKRTLQPGGVVVGSRASRIGQCQRCYRTLGEEARSVRIQVEGIVSKYVCQECADVVVALLGREGL